MSLKKTIPSIHPSIYPESTQNVGTRWDSIRGPLDPGLHLCPLNHNLTLTQNHPSINTTTTAATTKNQSPHKMSASCQPHSKWWTSDFPPPNIKLLSHLQFNQKDFQNTPTYLKIPHTNPPPQN